MSLPPTQLERWNEGPGGHAAKALTDRRKKGLGRSSLSLRRRKAETEKNMQVFALNLDAFVKSGTRGTATKRKRTTHAKS
jgi:hypothetical protein